MAAAVGETQEGQFAGRGSRPVCSSTPVENPAPLAPGLDPSAPGPAVLLGAVPAVKLRTITNLVPSTVIILCISPVETCTSACVYVCLKHSTEHSIDVFVLLGDEKGRNTMGFNFTTKSMTE